MRPISDGALRVELLRPADDAVLDEDPPEPLDVVLEHCPIEVRARAEEALELPPLARVRWCLSVLFGADYTEGCPDTA